MNKTSYNNDPARRVVVTGLGVVSSLGIGWQEFWKNLLAGKSGISKITAFDTSQYDRHYGGEVKDFDPTRFMSRKKTQYLGRASQMAIAASKLALDDAKLKITSRIAEKTAVCIGMTMAEMQLLENFHDIQLTKMDKRVYQYFSSIFPSNSVTSNVAIEFKIRGVNRAFATACAAGNYSIGYASDLIRMKKLDYALVGGADSFSRVVYTGFDRLLTIAPEKCQPFDKNRKGMIPGEGAGMLLLESLETAKKRRASIYAEILGYGMSSDAYDMTEPSVIGVTKALQKTLKNTGVNDVGQVDYISAHGTGTIENDEAECKAINRVFGKKTKNIPVSAIKSMLGHTMGASSALGAIACCLAIQKGRIPPTINHEHDDPKCAIDCVPNVGRRRRVKIALNNAQAFGGSNGCVLFQKFN
ncbi:MAG: beta-ketoacyl-[acyl-carrier-protein] synthase family protein [Candidatus Omnitrophica bacterium]|nr:beta-ketoacyl-[acyl-carrier-protein] synthase family protein [Candidatus Omnitrophota bacterium]